MPTPTLPALRELPAELLPRHRLEWLGPGSLNNAELLSLIIGSGRQGARGHDDRSHRLDRRHCDSRHAVTLLIHARGDLSLDPCARSVNGGRAEQGDSRDHDADS